MSVRCRHYARIMEELYRCISAMNLDMAYGGLRTKMNAENCTVNYPCQSFWRCIEYSWTFPYSSQGETP